MALHAFRLADLVATPWRNGGGTTREIVSLPAEAGFETFDWRVSVATIAADGPFSAFPGIDRTIMLLDGDGVRLRSVPVDGAVEHLLAKRLVPFEFSGDVALDCTLIGGESSDFNLMVRRGRGAGDVTVHRRDVRVSAQAGLVLALDGGAEVAEGGSAERLPGGAGLWWDETATLDLRLDDAGSAVVVVTWHPLT